ncbi:Outer membrane protein, OmpA/MotB family protein [Roseibacterium elongatum DSM 19469]|uniref:Outer membrane protein, OmpA/MotB family protein n=1 Tax=Roseicyclus elongatus DSM 19469 TaxID=1294273 RepID=W8S3R1_9RHOB|nr:OmpA family protein [Roseibacterium elongatum]AHM04842.1 Outer membrane protein, OmpA/MotB family protein [Roseibacterium elongatum DSM 19469]
MRRNLTTTTALVASLALSLPAPLPLAAQEAAPSGDVLECPPGLSPEECAAQAAQGLLDGAQEALDTAGEAVESGAEAVGEAVEDAADSAGQIVDEVAPADAAPEEATAPDRETAAPEESAAPEPRPVEPAAPVEAPDAPTPAEAPGTAEEADTAEEPAGKPAPEAEDGGPDAGPVDSPEQIEEALGQDVSEPGPDMADETGGAPEETPQEPATGNGDGAEAEADAQIEVELAPETPGLPETPLAAEEAATGSAEETMAGADAAEAVEETTETVTEETARRSDEDFAETGDPAAATDGRNRDDDGPGFLEGAVLGAAGAVVIGALLNGNREVVSRAPDRVVVQDPNGNLQVLRDDDAILRQPGAEVTTRSYADGSSQTEVRQPDGATVVTIRNAEARVVKRIVISPDGSETVLFDDTVAVAPVDVAALPDPDRAAAPRIEPGNEDALRAALMQQAAIDRGFSLNQVRQIERVRYLAPAVQVENITFETGSAAIQPGQAEALFDLGQLMTGLIEENPGEVFLIEGHTDAVGSAVSNLTLSDRRAETVARALTEYFGVSPANMVLQGYGESDLRISTAEAERANRRVVVRRITPLLQVARAD